ncbi:hypothetical protein KA062_02835 [Patescibacteria group bacterium]|nr:hypothetical protein [Patescibacteria group bacterium]
MKKTKEIPKIIYDMLTDLNIDRDFREKMAKELGVEMPDDHEEEFKQCYNDKMLEDAYEIEQEEKANYFNNLDNDEQ